MTAVDFPSSCNWLDLVQWGKEHYRDRIFFKDMVIPTRPGLLYLVHQGVVRLSSQDSLNGDDSTLITLPPSESILAFLGVGQPFEIVSHPHLSMLAKSHVNETAVIWLYWNELQKWQALYQLILEKFKLQHRQQLLWISILGQKSTLQRLIHFLLLQGQSFGTDPTIHHQLPYPITHAQISQAIGSTRVTVTRLLTRLRNQGLVWQSDGERDRLCFDHQVLENVLSQHLF